MKEIGGQESLCVGWSPCLGEYTNSNPFPVQVTCRGWSRLACIYVAKYLTSCDHDGMEYAFFESLNWPLEL